jgi:hypothetical protein
MTDMRDEFLSEEDLDLRTLSDEELDAYWSAWLEQAQSTNEADAHTYSHGVFLREPPAIPRKSA